MHESHLLLQESFLAMACESMLVLPLHVLHSLHGYGHQLAVLYQVNQRMHYQDNFPWRFEKLLLGNDQSLYQSQVRVVVVHH